MRYAYLGPEGTFTEAAVAKLRGPAERGTRSAQAPGVEAVPYPSISAVMTAVRAGEAERGVVPVESSVEGIVTATVDDLASGNDLLIAAETQLEIEFALLARPGRSLADIKTVGGHPQALPQCRRWLTANLPAHEWVPQASNAEAARQVAEGHLDAALAGAFAAAKYDLQVVAPDVHDRIGAVTRFLVVVPPGELPGPTKADRTSLAAFLREDHPGALLEILTEFAVRGVNLTTIQSRPTGEGLGNYFFFIDCEGHIDDTRVGEAMVGLRRVCAEVRFFGSYPRSDGGRTQVRAGTSNQEFAEALAWLGRLRFGRALSSGGHKPAPQTPHLLQPPSVLPAAPAGIPGNRRDPARLAGTAQVLARRLAAPRGRPRSVAPLTSGRAGSLRLAMPPPENGWFSARCAARRPRSEGDRSPGPRGCSLAGSLRRAENRGSRRYAFGRPRARPRARLGRRGRS